MKWIKRLGLLFVALVMVAILAATAFVLTFDPNDYKPQIAAQVEEQTGRSIQFNGDLSVTVFPWLGAATEDVVLANADGFEPEAMITVERLEAQAALLPLLRGEFEIGTLLLEGARINLARHEDGTTNWDDLVARQSADAAGAGEPDTVEPQDGQGPAMRLTVGGVEITDATVHWRDELAGQEITVEGLDLTTGELADGEPTDVELVSDFRVVLPDTPPLSGSLDLTTEAQVWFDRQDVILEDVVFNLIAIREDKADSTLPERVEVMLELDKADLRLAKSQARLDGVVLDLKGKAVGPLSYLESRLKTVVEADWAAGRYELPGLTLSADIRGLPEVDDTVSVSSNANVSADLAAGTATIDDFVLASDPVRGSAQIEVSGLESGEIVASGPVKIAAFDPHELADQLGVTLPAMRGDDALREFALDGQLDVTPTRAMFDKLKISLDGRDLTGRAGIDDLESGRLFARLEGGEFDLNPYLAPKPDGDKSEEKKKAAGGGGAGGSSAAGSAEIDLPTETLRGLNLDARLALASLRYEEYLLKKPVVHLTAAGGRIRLAELAANAFDGQINGSGSLDVRGEVPSYAGKGRVQGVSLQPLLMALMDEDRLIGKGDIAFDVATQGKRVDQLKSGLDGNAEMALRDGKIKGFDIGYQLRRAQAKIDGRTEPEPEEKSTDFTAITGTANIRNGVVRNDDLAGASPLLRVAGKGEVDLPRDQIDYRLTATVVNTATGQGGKDLERLKQVPVPIRIKGALADPSITLDLESLAKGAAKSKVKERVDEELDKRLGDDAAPVKELLKGLGL
ncbi:AsmA family protein [Guyparkeria hydrothermalis]|uniref:AsmA family protein n=1 Tax=Guyparkeria hydrothermalis TaxID=923 RepID=UPI002022243B|nr:AsmA family protein [Guyparkeria hydrothermalis]MCL7745173.1 AsmA family protein [Guyparkeria hydrothermalis]